MKLTIQSTADHTMDTGNPTVTYETPHDDATIDEVIDGIKTLLFGWGFSMETINEVFSSDDE